MASVNMAELSAQHTSKAAARRARRRHAAETRLKLYGIGAIALAAAALLTLMWSIVEKTASVVTEDYIRLEISAEDLDPKQIERARDPNPAVKPSLRTEVREALLSQHGGDLDRRERRQLTSLVSDSAGFELGALVKDDPGLIGRTFEWDALVDDEVQMYLKGSLGALEPMPADSAVSVSRVDGEDRAVRIDVASPPAFEAAREALAEARARDARRARAAAARQQNAVDVMGERLGKAKTDRAREKIRKRQEGFAAARDKGLAEAERLEALAEDPDQTYRLGADDPAVLIRLAGGWVEATEIAPDHAVGTVLLPLERTGRVEPGDWGGFLFSRPPDTRNVSNLQIALLEQMREDGHLVSRINTRLLTASDSSQPEIAGIWGAVVGSFWTMIVTFVIAFPVGVLASIYLEEFAPKNRFTDFIEVNINNLAAVPSIVFGLLGLAIFVSGIEFTVFGQTVAIGGFLPRSSPIAGGAVLALMTLPTIIIAGRAAIRAVPPSIREAALGLGASRLQTSVHHVLPLAMPGILTGSIIGMAQALGETAPLLMVGMNSFIQEPPSGPFDPANVLPTLVYQWNNHSERLFDDKTAAAISVLLVFLIAMNALAVLLRKKFERRW